MSSDQSKPKKSQARLPVAKPLVPDAPPSARPVPKRPQPTVKLEPAADANESGWLDAFTWRNLASFLVSFALHASILVLLSLLVWLVPQSDQYTLIISTDPGDSLTPDDFDSTPVFAPDNSLLEAQNSLAELASDSSLVKSPDQFEATQQQPQSNSMVASMPQGLLMRTRSPSGGGFQGRRGDRRGERLARGGGNAKSEEAVALGLEWLAAHQRKDGGWRFEMNADQFCNCRNPGTNGSTTGATGLALLPFLGAGHTHLEGDYQEVVHDGLYYLTNRMVMTPNGADLQEGTMYAQGIATIALCEAYAMTDDENMRDAAQKAVDFIC